LSEHQIRVACKSNNCAGATVGVKVVGYCRVGEQAAAASDSSMSVSPPELNIPRVKAWLVEARFSIPQTTRSISAMSVTSPTIYVGLFGNRRKH